ncbi:hypothetical protein ACUOCP_46480, partial [Escherichia sp. R-CC3]
MFGIIISVIVLITMGYLILKNYKPQVLLAEHATDEQIDLLA